MSLPGVAPGSDVEGVLESLDPLLVEVAVGDELRVDVVRRSSQAVIADAVEVVAVEATARVHDVGDIVGVLGVVVAESVTDLVRDDRVGPGSRAEALVGSALAWLSLEPRVPLGSSSSWTKGSLTDSAEAESRWTSLAIDLSVLFWTSARARDLARAFDSLAICLRHAK